MAAPEDAAAAVLEVEGVGKAFGGVRAVSEVSFAVRPGEMLALIGPNGAGKSTILRCISGMIPALGGTITLRGQSLVGRSVHAIAGSGIAHVPEDRALFRGLTVRENLSVPGGRRSSRAALTRAVDLFPELGRLLDRKAGLLSGGEQQMLALSRALAVEPAVIIVDEMSMGLAPIIVQRLLAVLRDVASGGDVGVLLVEQHVPMVLPKADRAYILVHGALAFDGPAETLRRDPDIVAATYLGGERIAHAAVTT